MLISRKYFPAANSSISGDPKNGQVPWKPASTIKMGASNLKVLDTWVENNNHEGGEQISYQNETTSDVQKTASIIIVEKNED